MINRINGVGYNYSDMLVYNPELVHLVPSTKKVTVVKETSKIVKVEKIEKSQSLQNDLRRRNMVTYGINQKTKVVEKKQTSDSTSHIIDAYA